MYKCIKRVTWYLLHGESPCPVCARMNNKALNFIINYATKHLKSVTFTIMLQLPLSGTYLFKMKMSTLVQTHIFMCRYKYFRK